MSHFFHLVPQNPDSVMSIICQWWMPSCLLASASDSRVSLSFYQYLKVRQSQILDRPEKEGFRQASVKQPWSLLKDSFEKLLGRKQPRNRCGLLKIHSCVFINQVEGTMAQELRACTACVRTRTLLSVPHGASQLCVTLVSRNVTHSSHLHSHQAHMQSTSMHEGKTHM